MQAVERKLAPIDEVAPPGSVLSAPLAEALEPRDMMSVSPTGGAHGELVQVPTVRAVRTVRQAAVNYLGNWSGVCHVNDDPAAKYSLTVDFTHQKGVAVTGTYHFSIAGGPVLASATIGLHPSYMVMLNGAAANVSFVGTMSANGKLVVGRWSALNSKGSWIVGTFSMAKN